MPGSVLLGSKKHAKGSPMSSDIAIKVENISKCYQIYERPRDRLLQMLARGHRQYFREFWALKGVSFEIKKGETVGIIGRNGSGKSTLLQIISGTLNPTSGSVQARGRIAALLELGSGFNPEFTGRENVYMNAALLGLGQKEIDQKFDDIVDFADIGDFIDQPVKTYSSGMTVRLAFAVQAQIEPDILIVDEALSVGDAKFQAKCFERLRQLKDNGTSILLVTHSSEQIVSHCTQAVLLDRGNQLLVGSPHTVVNRYMELLFGKDSSATPIEQPERTRTIAKDEFYNLSRLTDIFATRPGYNQHEYRWGDRNALILDYYLETSSDAYPSVITSGEIAHLALSIHFLRDIRWPILGITVKTKEGITIYGTNSELLGHGDFENIAKANAVVCADIEFTCNLAPGDYFVSVGIASRQGEEVIPHDRRYDSIHLQVQATTKFAGVTDLGLNINSLQEIA